MSYELSNSAVSTQNFWAKAEFFLENNPIFEEIITYVE